MKIPFCEWLEANKPSEEMCWKEAAYDQFNFIRRLQYLFMNSHAGAECSVISQHTSKSLKLPVILLERSGLKVHARGNFYDWKVSVESERSIKNPALERLIQAKPSPVDDPSKFDHECYFEGFPHELVFGFHHGSEQKFSAELIDDFQMYTFLFLVLSEFPRE